MFQSYLICGPQAVVRAKTTELAQSLGIDLGKVSPDIFIISPIRNSVTIDQIRDLKRHIFQKPVSQKYKFILIEAAEKLTDEAQNALLKILEEPPPHAILVLEAKNKESLLPTIRSRVLIKQVSLKNIPDQESDLLKEKNMDRLLEEISTIENPQVWLDDQILLLYNELMQNIRNNPSDISSVKISEIIEKCAQTKQMIDANVNSRFALANLIFSIHLNPNQSPQV